MRLSDPLFGTSDLETRIRQRFEAGELRTAMTEAVEGYGPELLGYLHAMSKNPADADELYAVMCERLWRAFPRFRFASSFRTWAYQVARNLLRDRARRLRGPAQRWASLSDAPEVAEMAERVRSTTALHLKTENKDRLSAVRETLDEEERTLLILRVDRRMSWREIADVMREDGDADLSRLASRLRKRFERLKERLRAELGHS